MKHRVLLLLLLSLPLLILTGCASMAYQDVAAEHEAEPLAVTGGLSMILAFDRVVKAAGGRVILSNASLRIEVDDPAEAVSEAMDLVRKSNGFVLSSSRTSITVRVPAEKFLALIKQYEEMGEVARKHISGRDVTESYIDLKARLGNAEKFRKRYEDLLKRAKNVKETLAVEKELERVQRTIEQLKGKLKYIHDRASLSHIDVSFEQAVTPGPLLLLGQGLYWALEKLFIW